MFPSLDHRRCPGPDRHRLWAFDWRFAQRFDWRFVWRRGRRMSRGARSTGLLLTACITASTGCISTRDSARSPGPPKAEFLVATPDSTFWVESSADGVRVRGVPMTMARAGDRYWEIYVTDLDRSFDDAIITGERLYIRDLLNGDSTLVLDDTIVTRLADQHAREYPNAVPLDSMDDDPEDPMLVASGETDIVDVRGPYVLFEHRLSVQHADGERFDTVRAAIDLRARHATRLTKTVHDLAAADSARATTLPYVWRRNGYALVAEADTMTGMVTLTLQDAARRRWPVRTFTASPRIYWLDVPAIPAHVRRALSHAFNAAAGYDAAVKFVRYFPEWQYNEPFNKPRTKPRSS